ncbi:preprotein translocase subunit SecE [uncultured Gemmiger sp.]|uniref:preprotein translocase subunit SecE n=1 Tax=uncultured Gemmiger sp. TaxID=1623490 RepID=UPI0025DAA67C|nr:preprotein translocase subunit SecE [uncultured Gemmiger sp.]
MADKKAATAAKGDQTDKKADKKPAQKKPGLFTRFKNFCGRVGKYFKDTKSELKKVVWPSKKQVRVNTITVLVVVLVAAVVLVVLDLIFGQAIHLMIGA